MTHERDVLKKEIHQVQYQLNKLIEEEGPLSESVLRVSAILDNLIVEYLKSA
ncbi:aspartyl-phosphate phosphatase Spo0E family protein [Petroclostridium sp. X23]|uniref:aspartyl-phosphate phosphatase Spo0E family protein n=1 Tax=Petroclostridium sp. X23 TaxID=3045146 RepID=UPI0024AD5AA1|nr:aspartyl-phosphate phosphatase Spo0E family protein [Petroclostridium sp. X23]WHH61186.1 aspartyl-phosphate phosphatase Spo0E family protein [Petroclostridium sp. X23]